MVLTWLSHKGASPSQARHTLQVGSTAGSSRTLPSGLTTSHPSPIPSWMAKYRRFHSRFLGRFLFAPTSLLRVVFRALGGLASGLLQHLLNLRHCQKVRP